MKKETNGHEEIIECSQCNHIQKAFVEHTLPWHSYFHVCENCKHEIMESEWANVKYLNNNALDGLCKIHHNMSSFIDRLLAEETELNERKAKLGTFIENEAFKNIDKEQQSLLKIQFNAMATYSECLNQRIIQINNKEPQASN